MKSRFAFAALAATGILSPLLAEPPVEQDLAKLREEHSREVIAAEQQINVRYKAALEQLLKRATQDGKLEEAVKIKAEIEALILPTNVGDPQAPPSPLNGTKWLGPHDAQNYLLFRADGTFVEHYNAADQPGTWRVISKDEVAATYFTSKGKNRVKHFRLINDGQSVQRVEDKVTWRRDH